MELRDENDHSPQFSQPYYQAEVSASTAQGTSVLTLSAEDPDSGLNSLLSFSLTHMDLPLSFRVNHSSGVVSTGQGFRGDVTSYVIAAAVSDRGAPQPRTDTTAIFITVVPDNDHPPQFSQPEGYSVVIPEAWPPGESVVQISARDPDPIDSPITFSISSGDPGGMFTVDPSTGLIHLSGELDYQTQSLYQLVVIAQDGGTPPRNSTASVNISIEDVNNHAPRFDLVQYTISILENTTVGTLVGVITASDPDAASITYILTVNSYDDDGFPLFSLDNETGVLVTTAPLDRELSPVHHLLVSAVDSGYPIRLSNSVPVTVVLVDLNDTPPHFDQSDYTFPLLRYLAPGLYVGMVTATDDDLIGRELEYSIDSNTSDGLFVINSTSGVILTRARVPEDGLTDYQLTVTVFDGDSITTVPVTLELTSDGHFCEGKHSYSTQKWSFISLFLSLLFLSLSLFLQSLGCVLMFLQSTVHLLPLGHVILVSWALSMTHSALMKNT